MSIKFLYKPTAGKMNFGAESKKTSQSRYAQASSTQDPKRSSRINYSPLRNPLQSAINKVVTTFSKDTVSFGEKKRVGAVSPGRFGSTPRSKIMNVSGSRNINNFSVESYDEDKEALEKMHPQPMEFLKKYFSGYTASMVPSVAFVDFLSKEYSNLWTESQAQAVFPEFAQKLVNKLGQEHVSMVRLYQLTKENGLIGLILGIFRELKNEQEGITSDIRSSGVISAIVDGPSSRYILDSKQLSMSNCPELQNVKNIIQEFTEGLYKSTENEIYAKLNTQMRRLVLKYKEAEGVLKTINDRINEDIDKIHYQRKKTQLQKSHQLAVERLNEKIRALEGDLNAQRVSNASLRAENDKYATENRKLTETVDRFQNHLLKKSDEQSSIRIEDTRYRTNTVNCLPVQTTSQVVSFAYQSPKPIYPMVDQRKATITTNFDKENKVSLNSLNGVVRPTTPLKGISRPSASPNRLLKVTRH